MWNMDKNIFIIGAARSGKTTLANKILKRFHYTLIDADAIREVIAELKRNSKFYYGGNTNEH